MKPENTVADAAPRHPDGRWVAGAGSPNPGGRPKRIRETVELAIDEGPASIRRLVIIRDGDDAKLALLAAQVLLGYGVGKPATAANSDEELQRLQEAELAARTALAEARSRELDLVAEVEEMRKQVAALTAAHGRVKAVR